MKEKHKIKEGEIGRKTPKGEKIKVHWETLVAIYVVMGKMSRTKAENKAYKDIVEFYGEETLQRELGIEEDNKI